MSGNDCFFSGNHPKKISELRVWLRFNRDRKWSRRQKMALLLYFGDINKVMSVSRVDATKIFNATNVSSKCRSKHSNIDDSKVNQELIWLEQIDHHLITRFDSRYPELLKHIDDPPIALFAAGNIDLLKKQKVAIVGSRRPSQLGANAASTLSSGLAQLGVAVVSGLALGIDSEAHKAALLDGGPTISVVATGIDIVYPRRHQSLFNDIRNHGLVISEYPLGLAPSRYTFPDRNRLISGLCHGVVVIEAAEKSGTLITARLALEQNRELMVVPGPALSSQYEGSHRLIKEGASLVCNTEDVLKQLLNELSTNTDCIKNEALDNDDINSLEIPLDKLEPFQKSVMKALDFDEQSIDELIERSGLKAAEVASALIELELLGMVASSTQGGYIRIN